MFDFKNCEFILASSSPRRKELLAQLGVQPVIIKPEIIEKLKDGECATSYVKRNSQDKADEIYKNLHFKDKTNYVILAADTVVVLKDKILEKPITESRAITMLSELSGNKHQVKTGVSLYFYCSDSKVLAKDIFCTTTDVCIKNLTSIEIREYVATKEPLDKAGSYAIQGLGSYMVSSINGSYTNVVGLPLCEVMEKLKNHYEFI